MIYIKEIFSMSLDSQNEIQDLSSLHHYRTEIPNVLFDMNLDPYEFKTYCVLKKTAGDRGSCFKSSDTLCSEIGCQRPKLIEIKRSLEKRGIIKILKRKHDNGGTMPDLITIVDLWGLNMKVMLEKYQVRGGGNLELGGGVIHNKGGGNLGLPKEEPKEEEQKQQQQYVKFAAAATFVEEEKATCQPKIHDILLKIDIPESDKIEITNKYPSQEIVRKALDWALHPETNITKGLAPALKWACKYQPEIPLPKKSKETPKNVIDPTSYNKCYWREINVALFKLGIKPSISEHEDDRYLKVQGNKIFYKDMSFLEQISNFLRKMSVQEVSVFKMIGGFQHDLSMQ
jgi:hypothetical protein